MDKISGVYEIVNMSNSKRYIGSSSNVWKRLNGHMYNLRKGKHENPHLQGAWKHYGEECFLFKPLLYCDKEMALVYEQMCLDAFKPEYNIATDAKRAGLGRIISEEHRRKLSDALKGRVFSEEERRKISAGLRGHSVTAETIEKIRQKAIERGKLTEYKIKTRHIGNKFWLGRHHTEETKTKISESHTGKTLSKEHRLSISNGLKGNQNRQGIPHTEDIKKKISNSLLGNKNTLGYVPTEETRRKLSEASRGRKHSDEARLKIANAKRLYWEKKRHAG